MKIKLFMQDKHWVAGLYKGAGGISSCVHYIKSTRFLDIFKVFKIANFRKAIFHD